MIKLSIASLFLLQNIIIYTYQIDIPFKLNLLLVPMGLYFFAALLIKEDSHRIIKFLGIFIIYSSFQTIMTTNSDVAMSHVLSDESGLLTYLSIGLIAAIGFKELFDSEAKPFPDSRVFCILLALVILVINLIFIQSIFSVEKLLQQAINIRFDADESGTDYQVIGDAYLLLFFIIGSFFIKYYHQLLGQKSLKITLFESILLGLIFLSGALASQIMGSNTSTVIILALGIVFLTITRFNKFTNISSENTFFSVYLESTYQLLIVALILLTLIVSVIFALNLENAFRFLNFDEDSIISTSITSRIDLLDNFYKTWNVSPFIGHMQADYLIYEPGKYSHSLPLSLLSHTGLIGFSLFFYSFYLISKDYFFSNTGLLKNKITYLFDRISIIIFISFAFLASFWAWSAVWFSIGFMVGYLRKL